MPQQSRRDLLKAAGVTAAGLAAGGLATGGLAGQAADAAEPFFKLYFMIPNNQPARMAWGTLAAQQWRKLGIDVVASYVPFSAILPRRSTPDGKTYVDGGWDSYLERYYYSSITPMPNSLFESNLIPPNGPNYYFLQDPVIDKACEAYAAATEPGPRKAAIEQFEKRWYDTEPLTILFYPEDVIAVNPKLSGFDSTTFDPVFYPRPENWTIAGAGDDATSAFACWEPPDTLLPIYDTGYNCSNAFGPVYDTLLEYRSWQDKTLVPALAENVTSANDGKHWVITLRQGVKWHSGEPFTAKDVKFSWDLMLNKAYASLRQAPMQDVFGSPDAYKITGPYEITVDLPAYSILFHDFVLGALAILPEHAYKDIKPEDMRGHVANTWLGTYTVKTSSGATYTAHGGIGTGAWIAMGLDPVRKAYKYVKNPNYWRPTTGNVKTYWLVNIQGTDAVLSALKSGEIDAHDPMYDIGSLVHTIDARWGKVLRFDSFKWQHICYNLRHPVFGTGVGTPLGKKDPSRAAEAAAYVRKAMSLAIPRDQIVKQIASGYGHPGTVPIPWSAPEYDHEMLKPIPFDMDQARQYLGKAGYAV